MPKSKKDPRHQRRRRTVQSLFAWSFNATTELTPLAQKIIKKTKEIDRIISQCAPRWPLEKINRTDLAILRLAIYELNYAPKIPDKVAIDEAVELAKEFGSESSSSFVNGALGAVYNKLRPAQKKGVKKDSDKNEKK
ncbi:MAG: transcription antitermination factor NusB [Patescibacteria group bacterium]|nr:transcription antitermination factor NusB [Patescibacteria group bacterium]